MTKVITNPTREQLVAEFAAATDAANAAGRTRLVDAASETRADRVLAESHGCKQADGGGVANSYGHRAETSVLAYAWYTRTDGVKVVRITAGRVGVSGRHVTSLNIGTRAQQEKLLDTFPAALVESDLFALYSGHDPFVPAGFTKKIKKAPAEVTNWLALADWCEENGKTGYAATIRGAVSPVECGC